MALSNKVIRERALTIYKEHRFLLALIVFIQSLPLFLFIPLNILYSQKNAILVAVITAIINGVIFFPLVRIGSCHILLKIWHGEKTTFPAIFYFYNKNDYLSAVLLGFIISIITLLFNIPRIFINIDQGAQNNPIQLLSIFALTMLTLLMEIWLQIKMAPAPYLYAAGYSRKPFALARESFRDMKNNVGGYIKFNIAVYWWRVLIILTIIFALFIRLTVSGTYNENNIYVVIVAVIFTGVLASVILNPYPTLAVAGFIDNLLPSRKNI